MSVTVGIADNHNVTQWGVQSVVENRGDEVVSTAETGQETLTMVDTHRPDLVIMSLSLPHLNGLEVLCRLQDRSFAVSSVLLTTFDDREHVRAAFERGASAYVLKQDPLGELDDALDAVRRGDTYISSALPSELMLSRRDRDASDTDSDRSLTMREREILQLTAEGFTSREAGARLDISHRTVEKHRENIKEKLGLGSVVEMVRYAFQRDMLLSPGIQQRRGVAIG
mgnify:CR=1 FL=1